MMDFKALYDKVAIKATSEYQQLCNQVLDELEALINELESQQEKIVYEGIESARAQKETLARFDFKVNDELRQRLTEAGFKVYYSYQSNRYCSPEPNTIVYFDEYNLVYHSTLKTHLESIEDHYTERVYEIRDALEQAGMIR